MHCHFKDPDMVIYKVGLFWRQFWLDALRFSSTDSNAVTPSMAKGKGKGKGPGTCYSAAYTKYTTHDQQHFTISEMAGDWHS